MKKNNIPDLRDWQLPDFDYYEFLSKRTKYCICIPIINEGNKFKNQIRNMVPFANLADIIIADGGSTDGSTDRIFLKKNKVRTLLVQKSDGKQGTALRMAFAYAIKQGYTGIITVDGNGKDGVDAIPRFVKALNEGYDCVAGSRFIKGGRNINTPIYRLIGIRFIGSPLLSLAAKWWHSDITNGFMAYSKNYLMHSKVKPFRNVFISYELLYYLHIRASQLRLRTKEIPVTRGYPKNEIPTKIHGLKANIDILKTFFKVALGYYNP